MVHMFPTAAESHSSLSNRHYQALPSQSVRVCVCVCFVAEFRVDVKISLNIIDRKWTLCLHKHIWAKFVILAPSVNN